MVLDVFTNKESIRRELTWSATSKKLNEELEQEKIEKTKMLETLFGADTSLRKLIDDLIYIDNVDSNQLESIQNVTTLINQLS